MSPLRRPSDFLVVAQQHFGILLVAVVAIGFTRNASQPAPIVDNTVPAPWQPAGFVLTEDPTVAYRWLTDAEFDCEIADRCWGMFVVPRDGCPASLYVELAVSDADGNAVGYTNDTAGSVKAGQQAKLIFDNFEDTPSKARLAEVSCR